MALGSSIEWTEATWNPVAGCEIISPGCTNCYAMRMAARLEKMGQLKYVGLTRKSGNRSKWNGQVRFDYDSFDMPKRWKRGRLIFVNSMSDLFQKPVPISFVKSVFDVIGDTPQHVYQILTKRAERLAEIESQVVWHDNIWMGVSVENADYLWRIDELRRTSANVKFLSIEPLLGPLPNLDLSDIDWVIVGGESGPGARSMDETWVFDIRDQCVEQGVAFCFKQWGGTNKKKTGRILEGRTWDEFPDNHVAA